jgi:hypothetical protein
MAKIQKKTKLFNKKKKPPKEEFAVGQPVGTAPGPTLEPKKKPPVKKDRLPNDFLKKPKPTDPATTRCAMDVRQCPDGSYVGRDSSRGCAFFPCPGREFEKTPPKTKPLPGVPQKPSPLPISGSIPTYEEWRQGKMFATVMVPDPRGGGGQVDSAYAEYLKATGQTGDGVERMFPGGQTGFARITPTLGVAEITPQIDPTLPQPIQQPAPTERPTPGVSPIHSKMKELYSPLPQIQLPQMQQVSMRRIFRILPLKRRTEFKT